MNGGIVGDFRTSAMSTSASNHQSSAFNNFLAKIILVLLLALLVANVLLYCRLYYLVNFMHL